MKKYINYLRLKIKKLSSVETSDEENVEKKSFKAALADNPYLQSKALWNDMYGDVESRYRRSQRLNFILAGVIGVAMVGFIIVVGETKIKPFPFIIKDNQIVSFSDVSSQQLQSIQPKLAFYFVEQFIRHARSVSVDSNMNTQNKIAAYSFLRGEATQVLNDFYEKNNPDQMAQQVIKDVSDLIVLPASTPNTLTVRWKEESRDIRSGLITKTVNYIAQITYKYTDSSQNITVLKNNPLGFYITYLSWSAD